MAETVAKVYGAALFELCCEEDCLDRVFEELCAVKELLWDGDEDRAELVELLASPIVSGDDKASVLGNIFSGRISDTLLDFLCLTAEKGRFRYLPEIAGEFRSLYNEKKGILEVTAVTAEPLTDRLRDKLIAKLGARSGKTVVLTERVDKSIIGGIVLRYGGSEIDSSVRTRLDSLKAQIGSTIA